MSKSVLTAKHFYDEEAAYAFVEARIWPHGPVCPHCGVISADHYQLKGKTTRPGLWKCKDCRKPFTVKIGSIFESSHIPLHTWLQAIFLMVSSKKGVSTHQLQRTLGITIKSAWHLSHRIREAMKDVTGGLMGGDSGTIEADETFIQRNPSRSSKGPGPKMAVMSLVERGGKVRSFHIPDVTGYTLKSKLRENVARDAHIITDEARQYHGLSAEFHSHATVTHSRGEYVNREYREIHTNTAEGFFSIMKRGVIGVYHHVSRHHLHRYCAEFDFRYNNREGKEKIDGKWVKTGLNDTERADALLKAVVGKRLTYQQVDFGARPEGKI